MTPPWGEIPSIEEFLAGIPFDGIGVVPLANVAKDHAQALAALSEFDPLRTAATFAGLLTLPFYQGNCIRIEVLVHLAIAKGNSHRKPNDKLVSRLFAQLGTKRLGLQEDPVEDVFVSSVHTPRGNFRVLEGVWESSGFYLQRLVGALERIPEGGRYDEIRETIYSLLKISDAVCERASLERHQPGSEFPQKTLGVKAKISERLAAYRSFHGS